MPERVRLSELATMSSSELESQTATLMEASRAADTQGSPTLERRIRNFEARYEMSSEALRRGLSEETVKETAEISEWLFLLDVRDSRAIR